jgi:hypothetical protein
MPQPWFTAREEDLAWVANSRLLGLEVIVEGTLKDPGGVRGFVEDQPAL